MQRQTFGNKNSQSQRQWGDRFVAPRWYTHEMRRRRSSPTTSNDKDIWHSKYLKQKKYSMFLDNAFDLGKFSPEAWLDLGISRRQENACDRPWPCVPRARNFLSSADSILDLPNYSRAPFPELLDWSSNNVLVAALGKKYHKWSWQTQGIIDEGVTRHVIHCCKFHPRGEMLALGTDVRTVELHDNANNKCVGYGRCKCSSEGEEVCTITALDWSPTGNSYVMGCSRGMATSFTKSSTPIHCNRVESSILFLRISPDARHVAVATVNTSVVTLLSWPSLELRCVLGSTDYTVKALTWHPWRSSLLALGAVSSNLVAKIVLFDVAPARLREFALSQHHYFLDAMLFSNRSGELVISLWEPEGELHKEAQIVILSDPDTAVDQWGEQESYLDRVRHMVFSPNGTKLATATAAEDLVMWNFLPEDKDEKKKKTQRRRFSDMPVYLDVTSNGFSVR